MIFSDFDFDKRKALSNSDHGQIKKFENEAINFTGTFGSSVYRPLAHDLREGILHNYSCDVYALGIMAYIFTAKEMPYKINTTKSSKAKHSTFSSNRGRKIPLRPSQNADDLNTQDIKANLTQTPTENSEGEAIERVHKLHRIGQLEDPNELFVMVFGSDWNEVSKEFVDLIRHTVILEQEKRTKISDILKLEYFEPKDEKIKKELKEYLSVVHQFAKVHDRKSRTVFNNAYSNFFATTVDETKKSYPMR